MRRWDEAENLIEQLWGKKEVEGAMEELRSSSATQGADEEISWSELAQQPYIKGGAYSLLPCSRHCSPVKIFSTSQKFFKVLSSRKGLPVPISLTEHTFL